MTETHNPTISPEFSNSGIKVRQLTDPQLYAPGIETVFTEGIIARAVLADGKGSTTPEDYLGLGVDENFEGWLEHQLAKDRGGFSVVAADENSGNQPRVVGFMLAQGDTDPNHPDSVWLTEIGTAADSRERGVGRKLLETLIDRAVATGKTELRFHIDNTNTTSQSFFKSVGGDALTVEQEDDDNDRKIYALNLSEIAGVHGSTYG